MMKSEHEGYFTLELALLFPVIFSIIVLIIYTAFFVHDRAVMDSAAYEAALRGSAITYPGADIEGRVRREADDLLKSRLFVTKNTEVDVDINIRRIKVDISGEFKISSGLIWTSGLREKDKKIKVSGIAERLNPGQVIRDTGMIKGITKK